jgi:hypothetical protein
LLLDFGQPIADTNKIAKVAPLRVFGCRGKS